MRKFLILFFFLTASVVGNTQVLTNSGTDFWFAFPETFDENRAVYWLNITSNTAASGTVSIPGGTFSQSFSVTKGQITRVMLNSNDAWIRGSDVQRTKAIHVTSNNDVVVFAVTYHNARHEAALVLPTPSLGTRYRVMSHKSEIKSGQLYESEFTIVAAGDTAVVEITPKGNIAPTRNVNTSYTVTIPPNSVYQAQARNSWDDLTGTLLESKNGESFAVYSGNVWSTVVCSPNSDPLLEGMFPVNTWGKDYFAIPTPTINKDYIRIMADKDSTKIYKDGVFQQTIQAGQFWDETITAVHNYTSNNPIAVAHFLVTGSNNGCAPTTATDPSMIMLNATEQMFLDSITFFAVDTSAITKHFVHVITKTADTNVMYIDSVRLTKFNTFTQNTNYSYKSITTSPGYHRLETTGCGFIAYSMGIGNAVSYGYATGVSLVNLENAITYSNFVDGSDTICKGDTVKFKSILRGSPLSFFWDMGDGFTDTVKNPIHSYSKTGEYYIKAIITYECLTDTLRDTLYVPPSPIIDLGPDTILCNKDTLRFKANTRYFETLWSTGSKDSLMSIVNSGTYSVKVSNFCGADYDTIVVDSLLPDTVFLGVDTIMCKGVPFEIDITAINNSTYLWNDSATVPKKVITQAGTYWGQVQNFCGIMRDTIVVLSDTIPDIDLGADTTLCIGQTQFLNAYFSRSKYKWQDGNRSAFQRISAPGGKIWVQVSNLCGAMVDSITINYDYPLNIDLGRDSIICLGDEIFLDPITNGASCIWHNGSTDTTFSIFKRGQYWVEASNVCGKYSDTVNFVDEQTPRINLPEDQLKCDGDTVLLNAVYSRASYQWNTGATSSSIVVNSPGYYQVQTTNLCGFDRDSLIVIYDKPLIVDLGPDTLLCDQGSFVKSVFFPNNPTYLWNTGHNAPSINIGRGGKFVVSVTNRCGTYSDAIQVGKYYTPRPKLRADTLLCSGEILPVSMGLTDLQMQGVFPTWENGSHARSRAITKSGKYWVHAQNVCGEGSDSAEYNFNNLPYFGLNDTMFCYGEILQYDFSEYQFRYYWDKEIAEGDYFEIDKPGDKLLWIIDSIGCLGIERFSVVLCPNPLYAPNAFSPNSDGVNEAFRLFRMGTYDFNLTIVNEWNETVFSAEDITQGWNGKKNNIEIECPIGAYIWRATYKDVNDHQIRIETGEVMLIR